MKIETIKTIRVEAGATSVYALLDNSLKEISEGSIVVVTSKIISLCENRVVKNDEAQKQSLIEQESQVFLPASASKYGLQLAITQDTLIAAAGIDESNGGANFILWPSNPQNSANEIRDYLVRRFGIQNIGVIITDSTCMPLRLGTIGICIAHSGFKSINNYIGKPDLFGRPFGVSQSNVAGGLAAAAVVMMGEGTEQTPIAVIEDVPFVDFQPRNPTEEEIANLTISKEDDLFAPFLDKADWQKGSRN
jgi:putative folate metabolism gamma-glutamate ligase